jgi:hypothetical protein
MKKCSRNLMFAVLGSTCGCSSLPIDAVKLEPATLNQGLIAHWRFDEVAGNTAYDTSGNRRDGVLTGGTWLSDGRFNGALRLGNGEFVTVNPFPDATVKFSVSAWVRILQYTQDNSDLGQWGTIVSTELGSTGGWEVNVNHNDPSPVLNFGLWKGPNQGDYDAANCACLELDRWTEVVAVVESDLSKLSFFVDGQLRSVSIVSRGILPGSPSLTIGQWPYGARFLNGDVDDIAVWNRALVAGEVAKLNLQPPPDPM